MSTQRGVVDTTLTSYRRYVTQLVDSLGDDPQTYTAHDLRDFVAKRYQHYGRNSIRMVLAAVRMFLRYLAVEGRCRGRSSPCLEA
jgi:site-specific recombinase XerD